MKRLLSLSALLVGMLFANSSALQAQDAAPKVGLQTWTVRNLDFDQMVAFAKKHNIKYLQCISKHMNPADPVEVNKKKKEVLDASGLVCYTFGVAGTSAKEEENRKLFEFAKLMGIKLIVVEPSLELWDGLEKLVKEYDVKLAIHNHGKGTTYGDPATVKKVLKDRDARIGVCLDAGWVTGAGLDVAKVFSEYEGRVFDIHLKDKKVEKLADGKDLLVDVEIGTGQSNFKGLFSELQKANWNGVMAIETDNNMIAKDPGTYVDNAVSFAKKLKP